MENELKLSVDGFDEGSDKVDGLNDSLKDTKESSSKAGSGLDSFKATVTATTAAIVATIAVATKFAEVLKENAIEWERQAGIMNRFSGDASEASRRIGGLISNLNLMIAQSKLSQAGLQITAHQMANLAVAANEMASATGEDATQGLERLSQALIAGGADGLKPFGVNVEGITDKTRATQEAFAQLEERWGSVNSSADTIGGRFASLDIQTENFKTEVFGLLTANTGLTAQWDSMTQALSELGEAFHMGQDPVRIWAAVIAGTLSQTMKIIEATADGLKNLLAGNFDAAMQNAGQVVELAGGYAEAVRAEAGRSSPRSVGTSLQGAAPAPEPTPRPRGGGGAGQSSQQQFDSLISSLAGGQDNSQELADMELINAAFVEQNFLKQEQIDLETVLQNKQAERAQQNTELIAAESAAWSEYAAKQQQIAALETQLSNQRRTQVMQGIGLVSQASQGILQQFGATQGQMELMNGLIQTAEAIGSYPDVFGIAQHGISAALHFANAARLGVSGGGSQASATSQVNAARTKAASPNDALPRITPENSGRGSSGATIINVYGSVYDTAPLAGRDVGALQRAAETRY